MSRAVESGAGVIDLRDEPNKEPQSGGAGQFWTPIPQLWSAPWGRTG